MEGVMKWNQKFIVLISLMPSFVQAEGVVAYENDLPAYKNQIVGVQEMQGVASYTIKLNTLHANPIVSYAPRTFAESQDATVHRYLLPNTTIEAAIENDFVTVEQSGSHVQLLITGDLKFQAVGEQCVSFVIG
jgi:hypothetical protein